MMRAACLLSAIAFVSINVSAQETRGAYLGFASGDLSYQIENIALGWGAKTWTVNQARLIGGYRFSERKSIEGGWGRASGLDYAASETGDGWYPLIFYSEYAQQSDFEVLTIRAVGRIPFRRLHLFGGVGYYSADRSGTFSSYTAWEDVELETFSEESTGPLGFSDSNSGLTLSGGVQFDFGSGPSLRLEGEYFFASADVSFHAVSLGLLYRLGQKRAVSGQ